MSDVQTFEEFLLVGEDPPQLPEPSCLNLHCGSLGDGEDQDRLERSQRIVGNTLFFASYRHDFKMALQ